MKREPKYIYHTSVDDLLDDIKHHVATSQGDVTIIPVEASLQLMYGFGCLESNKIWLIKENIVRKYVDNSLNEGDGCNFYRRYQFGRNARALLSQEGKQAIARFLSKINY